MTMKIQGNFPCYDKNITRKTNNMLSSRSCSHGIIGTFSSVKLPYMVRVYVIYKMLLQAVKEVNKYDNTGIVNIVYIYS